MRINWFKTVSLLFIAISLLMALPACEKAEAADSYVAIVPEVLHSGRTEAVSISLLNGGQFVKDTVEVAIFDGDRKITSAKKTISGNGTISLDIPDVDEGKYEIRVKGTGFTDKALVNIEKNYLVFVETDKPIYKPGQTIQMRVFALDPELKPVIEPVTVEVLDNEGIKIFRTEVTTDEYGMANLELPISDQPNLGVWEIRTVTEKSQNQLDIRVEEYVLPKYEVTPELPKEWFLVNELISGKVKAEYSFGKPVEGELTIEALRYVGQWQTYTTLTKTINGEAEFELPAVGYVTGTPASGGQGNVQLNITVTEKSTSYVEKTSLLLTVSATKMNLQLIPEGSTFKPGLPFNFLVVTETHDNKPVVADIQTTVIYSNSKFETIRTDEKEIQTTNGTAVLEINPPADAIALTIEAFELTPISSIQPANASLALQASYSPSGNFIHLEQISEGTPKVGQKITFQINSTNRAVNFYYEIIARGKVVFSDYTRSSQISIVTTPLMAPSAKILVYQILPNSEVAADYLPFSVEAVYPQTVTAEFSETQVAPGEEVHLNITTEGAAKVGIAAVDKSVFILAGNRMNLQQVFDELERLYMEPQAEIHEISFYPIATTVGAAGVFDNAGVVVMTNKQIPENKEHETQGGGNFFEKLLRAVGFNGFGQAEDGMIPPGVTITPTLSPSPGGDLAEVQRVRQFFPETWLWFDITTDASGKVTKTLNVPDTITTWMLRAVAISKENGLGVAESSLIVFQPFFLSIDLPYAAIRGEEFPVQVAIYNYLDAAQTVQVDLEESDWFELLDNSNKTVDIAPNDIGSVQFMIKPTRIGINEVEISARSPQAADAVIKTIIIQPEGVAREIVDNLTLTAGDKKTIDTSIPDFIVSDSGRALIALTSSFLTQTIDGLDALLQMPFGCGEQNMIVFAPDVYITKYLRDSGQLKPETMAKAEKLMITGYQRELTYRRTDGSFSAFGMSDESGSLFLTAFVLKCFSEAQDLIYIDDSILSDAIDWIVSHQNSDGSFDQVGFVHHQEMLGGLQGKDALTAYVAVALMEAGEKTSSAKAIAYLGNKLSAMTDHYAIAITAYAFELAQSPQGENAYNKLMSLAKADENGLYWGSDIIEPEPITGEDRMMPMFRPDINRSASIETTAYATLALIKHEDAFNASRSSKWLVSKRNAYGGYGSTQDTIVTLQALTEYATDSRSDADLTITLKGDGVDKTVTIDDSNFDVLQIVEVPVNTLIEMTVTGTGNAIGQVVRRFNEPATDIEPAAQTLKIDVDYDTTEVEVNDLVTVSVGLTFNPLPEMNISEAGMIVLDVSIPTGFEAVTDSITAIMEKMPNIKRYDIAGRKVIFYVENMKPGESLSFEFQVRALYPVKAKGVTSTAYSYYKPDIKGETLSDEVTVK
jgi:CD109 antigen